MTSDRPKVIATSAAGLLIGTALIFYTAVQLSSGQQAGYTWILAGCFALFVGVVLAIALTKDPFRKASARGRRPREATAEHILAFTVGKDEKHVISYRWDQVWGWLTVTVDDVPILKKFVLFDFRLTSVVEFEVGRREKHTVRVEKRRSLVTSFARPQPITGFVDGRAMATHDGTSAVEATRPG